MKDSQNNSRKKSFILYNDQIEIFKELSPEQAGHLIKHVYDYSSGIETTSFQDPSIKIAFIMIKGQMDRDSEKYTQKCEKNRQNINKRYEGKTTTVYDRIRPSTKATDTDNDTDNKKKKHISVKRFIKPTIEEIIAYCKERKNTIKPQVFIDHYTSNGWMVGKNKMKDWKATIRNWEQRDQGGNYGRITGSTGAIIKKTGGAKSDGKPYPIDFEG